MARPQEFDTAQALSAAMHVFWRKGYEATSLADIMAATGLSKSSLYAAFGDKRSLFLAALSAYQTERMAYMATGSRRWPPGAPVDRVLFPGRCCSYCRSGP